MMLPSKLIDTPFLPYSIKIKNTFSTRNFTFSQMYFKSSRDMFKLLCVHHYLVANIYHHQHTLKIAEFQTDDTTKLQFVFPRIMLISPCPIK
jgi:hypothetical protein